MKDGKYVKSIKVAYSDTKNNSSNDAPYHLYPGTEIPPRTEVVIVARSKGGRWMAMSGIDGDLVYTNRSETWTFRIRFCNERFAPVRRCDVKASRVTQKNEEEDNSLTEPFWQMSREELDRKQNNEVVVSIDMLKGDAATYAAMSHRQSQTVLKVGMLLKNMTFGLRLQWHQRWVKLTMTEIVIEHMNTKQREGKISIQDIISVRPVLDAVVGKQDKVFEIQAATRANDNSNSQSYKFCAASQAERDEWIQLIQSAHSTMKGQNPDADLTTTSQSGASAGSSSSSPSYNGGSRCFEEGFECVQVGSTGAEVLPPI